jgi:hypothetical protein
VNSGNNSDWTASGKKDCPQADTDGREIVLTRHTHPEKDLQLLLSELKIELPQQPPLKIHSPQNYPK